ncbi:MAG: HAMP domain-containing protein [Desulfurivibrionaceae bacterium]
MLAKLSLRNKFLLSMTISIVLLGVGAALLTKPLLENKLYATMVKRGISIARSLAFNTAHNVLEEQYLELHLTLDDYLGREEDVVYIFVSDGHDRILAHTFDGGFPLELIGINRIDEGAEHVIKQLLTEEGEIIDIAMPVLNSRVGSLHVGISGEEIRKAINSFVGWILGGAMAVLLAGAAMAILASRLITNPLEELARAAGRVAAGDLDYRVPVRSGDEIGRLKAVFNDMVEKRQQREQERELLIGDLQAAIAEVKVLSGMLPICASCKNIRDDQGYWKQIESYIQEHSEAEFTHGLCPECAHRLYPEFTGKI